MHHEAFYATVAQVNVTGLIALTILGTWRRARRLSPQARRGFVRGFVPSLAIVFASIICALVALAYNIDTAFLRTTSGMGSLTLLTMGGFILWLEAVQLVSEDDPKPPNVDQGIDAPAEVGAEDQPSVAS